MKIVLFFISVFFIQTQLFGQVIKAGTKKLIEELLISNELKCMNETFFTLRDSTSISEFVALLNYNNPVIKGYASWALADKKYPDLESILIQFLDSKEMIDVLCVDNGYKDYLASFFYYCVIYQNYNKISVTDSIFYREKTKRFDSIILYYSHNTSLLEQALEHNNAKPETYDRIRKLALNKKNDQALIELAKYRKKSDIESIKKLGKKAFLAISYFPDNNFWTFLEKYLPTEESLEFYLAIAGYKSNTSTNAMISIFNRLDKLQKSEQIKNLDEALIRHYCASYQDLLLEIWEKYKTINLSIINQLINDCPEKASKSFTAGLLNKKKLNFWERDYRHTNDSILPKMLSIINIYDKEKLLDICKINVEITDFLDQVKFLNIIRTHKFLDLAELLIATLKNEIYPFEIFYLTETLISFNSPEIKLQLSEILKDNKIYWDKGNWSEAFYKLLDENNIKINE